MGKEMQSPLNWWIQPRLDGENVITILSFKRALDEAELLSIKRMAKIEKDKEITELCKKLANNNNKNRDTLAAGMAEAKAIVENNVKKRVAEAARTRNIEFIFSRKEILNPLYENKEVYDEESGFNRYLHINVINALSHEADQCENEIKQKLINYQKAKKLSELVKKYRSLEAYLKTGLRGELRRFVLLKTMQYYLNDPRTLRKITSGSY